jgi:hypothetical protein
MIGRRRTYAWLILPALLLALAAHVVAPHSLAKGPGREHPEAQVGDPVG